MNPLLYPLILSFTLGLLCLLIPKRVTVVRELFALLGSAGSLGLSVWLFLRLPIDVTLGDTLLFHVDTLAGFGLMAASFFGLLVSIYSIRTMADTERPGQYYASVLWTLAASMGVLAANHLLLLLTFWGFLGVTLFLLVLSGGREAASAAKKSLIIIGSTDVLFLFGILLLYAQTGTFEMHRMSFAFSGFPVYFAFFLFLAAAFAKAGSMPLHTWIPDVAEAAPIPVTALLPASLDKLLGIYLLIRMCLDVFVMNASMNLILMVVGAFTIIAGVMMALVQHDMKKLLAYHAVSQVGYMVLGIGTGLAIGIIGGLFHMLNNMIYKTGLFFTAGSVKRQTGSTDLDKLSGLGRLMPWTFISFIVAAVAISGIPPFNGFVSKWMIYQGLVEMGKNGDNLWVVWLIAAMFGSGLTLASFMKLTHSVFLGDPSDLVNNKQIKENSFSVVFPMVTLAVLCLGFGIFAYTLPLKLFLVPAIGAQVNYVGIWSPGMATLMIVAGLIIGLVIYLFGNMKQVREADSFIGGETLTSDTRITGTSFYNTIKNFAPLARCYRAAEGKFLDLYEQGMRFSYGLGGLLKRAHNGLLNLYLIWLFVGLVVLLFIMMGR